MYPRISYIGFGAQRHVRKSRIHRNEGFEGSPINTSKSYKFKMEQNNTIELLSISYHKLTITITHKIETNVEKAGFSGSSIGDRVFLKGIPCNPLKN